MRPLSRGRIETFRACQRRFQLRYMEQLPWPSLPPADSLTEASQRGQAFHQLLAQQFLGFPTVVGQDEKLAAWWQTFQRLGPKLPDGKRLTEITLTIPFGSQRLTGRFDLIIKTPDHLYLYDWKTERQPRASHLLKEDWQTKLYLYLAVSGGGALGGETYRPDQVSLTYWFVAAPERPVSFLYTQTEHDKQHQALTKLIGELEHNLTQEASIWPLTENLSLCKQCAYRIFCGRAEVAATAEPTAAYDWWDTPLDEGEPVPVEPDWS